MDDALGGRLATAIAYLVLAAGIGAVLCVVLPVVVRGGSMRPTLHPGDLVIVRRGARVCVGDVALLRPPGHGPVLHRVIEVDKDGSMTTRGDANPIDDTRRAGRSEVAGRVVAVLPAGAMIERWRAGGNRATLSTQSNTTRR